VGGLSILAIAFAFGLIVFVHEAGHFIAARLSGMGVREFSIGFGRPLLFSFKRGETQYSFRLWPFFSFVRVAGMEPDDDHPQGFHKKSRLAQAFVLASGCIMNFLLAAAIYACMGALIGMPVALKTIKEVMPDTPAAAVGLKPGDRLLGVEDNVDLTVDEIRKAIQDHADKPLVLEIERGGVRQSIDITPAAKTALDMKGLRLTEVPIGRIGIAFDSRFEHMGIGRSIFIGFAQTFDMIHFQLAVWLGVISRSLAPEFAGPVGVVHARYADAKAGWFQFLSTFAAIAIAIGFLNLLPIPPLDGSRLAIVALEALRGKPFDKRKEIIVHLIGFAILLTLLVVLTFKDILRIAGQGG
jgi:regulator of sigma E protease